MMQRWTFSRRSSQTTKTHVLNKKLVYELQIAQNVGAFQDGSRLDGKFQINVTPKPGQNVAGIDRIVKTEIANVISNGITPRELQRAQNLYKASFFKPPRQQPG